MNQPQEGKRVKVKLSTMARREERWAYLFVAAPLIGFALFMLYPIILRFSLP